MTVSRYIQFTDKYVVLIYMLSEELYLHMDSQKVELSWRGNNRILILQFMCTLFFIYGVLTHDIMGPLWINTGFSVDYNLLFRDFTYPPT